MADTPLHIPWLVQNNKWNDYRQEIWGDSFNWDFDRTPDQVQYLVIHHTVTKHEATPQDIALLHKARGWKGIGYHFVITKDGVVHYVGDVSMARANVLNMNEKVIGIALIGDFTKHNPSDEQIISAHELCKFFLFSAPPWQNLNGWEDVVGHKELQATQCPGTNWKGPSDSTYNRIKDRIPYSTQEQPITTPTEQTKPESTELEALRREVVELKNTITQLEKKLYLAKDDLNLMQEFSQKQSDFINKIDKQLLAVCQNIKDFQG